MIGAQAEQSAALGARPDAVVRGLRYYEGGGTKALRRAELQEVAVAQAVHTVHGRRPDVALSILGQLENITWLLGGEREGLQTAILAHPPEAIAIRTQPQIAVTVAQRRMQSHPRLQRRALVDYRPGLGQAVGGACRRRRHRPEFGVIVEQVYLGRIQATAFGEVGEVDAIEATESIGQGTYPNGTAWFFQQAESTVVHQAIILRPAAHLLAAQSRQTLAGREPQCAVGGWQHIVYDVVAEPLRCCIRCELPVDIMQDTSAVGGEPHAAVIEDFDVADIVGAKSRLILLVEEREADAVEARQAVLGPQPEESIQVRPGYPDGIGGQALLAAEAVKEVLAGQAVRVQRKAGRR